MKLNMLKVIVDYPKTQPGENFHAQDRMFTSIKSPRISRKTGRLYASASSRGSRNSFL